MKLHNSVALIVRFEKIFVGENKDYDLCLTTFSDHFFTRIYLNFSLPKGGATTDYVKLMWD